MQSVDFAEQMRDAPRVTSQQTFYKTYYKLPVSTNTYVNILFVSINLKSNLEKMFCRSYSFTITSN